MSNPNQQASSMFTRVYYSIIFALFGAFISLSLAPYNIWPASIISIAFLLLAIKKIQHKKIYWYAGFFGLGQFASGVYWVYISIHDQSNTPAILAVPMTFLWCVFLSSYTVLFVYLYKKLTTTNTKRLNNIFLAPALWVLIDFLRSWAFTGFPWLYIGHSQIETPISGWIPIFGTQISTFILVLCASTLVFIFQKNTHKLFFQKITLCLLIISTLVSGYYLKSIAWTKKSPKQDISISIIQANISQNEKWLPQQRTRILDQYSELLDQAINTATHRKKESQHLFIFPETALPDYALNLKAYLTEQINKISPTGSTLLTGLVTYDFASEKIFNSIAFIGDTPNVYHKQHLVPLGEYVPFEWLRNLGSLFNLPMSSFSVGASDQPLLEHHGFKLAPFICYEIVYPRLVRKVANEADVLLTLSNDTWFGTSSAPNQHMQIAQFRALENGRYLIRSTNNGITGIVNEKGKLIKTLPQFQPGILTANIPSFTGQTPYNRWGDFPLILFCLIITLIGGFLTYQARHQSN